MSVNHESDAPTSEDENFLARDDHDRLAHLLSGLHATLATMERSSAPLQVALEHAGRLVEALRAGLIHDHQRRRGDLPPYLVEELERPPGYAFPQIVWDAWEVAELIEARPLRDCIVATAHALVEAAQRVRELINPGYVVEVTSCSRGRGTTGAALPHEEYQRTIEDLAVLGTCLQVLHHTAYLPAAKHAWGLTTEYLETIGRPEGIPASLGMIDFWETSNIDDLMWCQLTVVQVFYAMKHHVLFDASALDLERMDGVRRDFQAHGGIDPDHALAMLVPAARTIEATLTARSTTCACIRVAAECMTDAMEWLEKPHRLAPRPRTH
jgi:hypothetical protein